MKRKALCLVLIASAASLIAQPAAPPGPLRFPADTFTTETVPVKTSKGEVSVRYRAYRHIPYVAHPIDKDFQSLDVRVPIAIDGAPVDAAHAPILLVIGVGGYLSSSNAPRSGPPRAAGPGAVSRNSDLALAAGYVVVLPGARGRDNRAADGTYYGKAPAAIVDLKAAVRYLRHNAGILPGNTGWIVSTGVSAGGALSALLGASGNSRLYEDDLRKLGAADAPDTIFASADFCPIADLEHADMAYEWMWGPFPSASGLQNQQLSAELAAAFAAYQSSLQLQGSGGFGPLTAENYAAYLLRTYLHPAATRFLRAMNDDDRRAYLTRNPWITWSGNTAAFTFDDFRKHVGRMKGLPAFDDFAMRRPEPNEFGDATTDSRHFTTFSLRHATGDPNAQLAAGLPALLNLMNPMYFIGRNHPGIANHWWIRVGASDAHTALTVVGNLAASLENRGKDVNALMYWDAGHGADLDAEDFIAWIARITGYTRRH